MTHPDNSEIVKNAEYESYYNPDKLFPIQRKLNRDNIGIVDRLPFFGFDLWNHYEVSWLNEKGKPVVALAEIIYGCDSPYLIESKSMKLYFNTFNNTHIKDMNTLQAIIKNDLSVRVGSSVDVKIIPMVNCSQQRIDTRFQSECIDVLDVDCSVYTLDPSFLHTEGSKVKEVLYSDLLKSNCLVTNQPDWGSVQITYQGQKINREGLLRYIVSFRNCNEFSEQCIERMFMDIMTHCSPNELTIYGRYTRRGGIDINPYRSTKNASPELLNLRLCRQ